MAEDLLITLGVQDKGVSKQISALNKELKYLDKEFKATGKTSKDFEKTQDGLKAKLKYLEQAYNTNKAKLDVYKKKLTETKTSISEKEKELEKLTNAENVNEKAVEKVSKQLDTMRSSLRQTEQNINLTEIELENLTEELNNTRNAFNNSGAEEYKRQMKELGSEIEKSGEKITKFGQGMSTVGGNLMKFSAPLVAFAGYAAKVTMDFEQGMAKVQSISGATGAELEKLKDKAKEMGRITKFSATESAEALSYMAMAGWKTGDMIDGLEGIMNLAAASGEQLALVSDIVTDALTAFGMSAKDSGKFADILASASSNANTNVAMMGETFKYVAPVAGAMKYTAEDTAIAIGLMANSGIKASQAGTSLRQVLMGLQGGVEVATKSTKRWRIEVENQDGTMRDFRSVLVDLREAFADMTDAQKAQNAESIAGKVGMSGLLAIVNASATDFNKLANAVDNSTGSAKNMADIMNKTAHGQITLLKSQLEALGIQVGEKLLPHINAFIEKLSKLIEWFGNLDEGTQQAIVKFGLLTFAIGGALKSIGGITQGIGGLVSITGRSIGNLGATTTAVSNLNRTTNLTAVGGVAKLASNFLKFTPAIAGVTVGIAAVSTGMKMAKTNSELLGKTVLTTTDNMSGMEKTVSKLNGMHFKSREELIKLGLVYKDFGSNISEEFQQAVKNSQKSILDFNLSLKEISFDNALSEEEIKSFNEKVKGMCDSSVTLIKEKQKESKEALSEMFKLDDEKIDEQEQKVIEILQKHSDIQIEEVNKLEKEIYAIKDQAVKDKRGLNDQEIRDIELKTQRIKEIELEALGGTQEEILYAKNEFAARIATLDLETASALLQEKAKLRDEEITKISASYDTQIQLMQEKLPLLNEEDRKAVEAQILKHQESRDKKIEAQYQLYDELLRITGEKNPDILAEINRYNGEILTADDKKAQQLAKQYDSNFAQLKTITESGTYYLYNQHAGMWENVTVKVDERSGQIIGLYSDMQNKSGGYTAAMGRDMEKLGKEHATAQKNIRKAVKDSETLTVNSSGQIVTANGKVVTSLEKITEGADGTRTGIITLNDTPVKVEVNKDGAVTNLDAIRRAVESIPTSRRVTISTNYSQAAAPSSNKGNGKKSIPTPNIVSNIPTFRTRIPEEAENIITDGGYYNSRTPEARQLVNTFNAVSVPRSYSGNAEIDYNKLANIMSNTLINALKGLKLEPNVNVSIDGTPLNNKFSNNMAMNMKRSR